MTAETPDTEGLLTTRPGRRAPPILWLPVVGMATLVYGALAWQNPIINQSPVGLVLLSVLFLVGTSSILMSTNADMLDPFRVMTVYYLVCFCIAPLFVLEPLWHFADDLGTLVTKASAFLLAGYGMMALGYALPVFPRTPVSIPIFEMRASPGMLRLAALSLFVVGQVSLAVLFVRVGGLGVAVGGDEAKNVFLQEQGIFVWTALFAFSGGVLYFASKARPDVPRSWLASWPLWVTAVSWIVFQSRMKVLNVLVMGLLISHYLVRPLRIPRLAIFGAAGFVFVVFVGFARNTQNRFLLLTNPGILIVGMLDSFWEISQVIMSQSFARLRQIMLIFDKVPSWVPHDWGASFLMPLNPFLRITGMSHLQFDGIGPRLHGLAHPEIAGLLPTGYLPSLPGEFLWNFPFYVAIFPFMIYGMVLRWIYARLVLRRANPASIALYAILLLGLVNMIFASCGQNLFEFAVLALPAFFAVKIAELFGPSGTAATAPMRWEAPATPERSRS